MITEEMLLQFIEVQKQTNERLDKMDGRFDKIDERLDKMDDRLDKMDGRLDKMDRQFDKIDSRLDTLEKDVKVIKLTLENDISPSIKMLSEFQLENSKRLIKLEKDVTEIKDELAINDVLQGLKENNMM